ncbi:MAG: sulfite exporter TauE/SafE family protein [Reinekea sp.]
MFDLYWWLTALALFFGCMIQTALGFGMAVIAAPIIVLFKPEWVPIILTIVALFLSIQNAWNQRTGIEWRHISTAMIFRIPGTILGAWILTLMPTQTLQLCVAGMVFVAVFITAFARPFAATPVSLGIAGFNTRANLSVYFAYSCVTSLVSYQLLGILNKELWLAGISFLPIGFAGYFIGKISRSWVDQRFRPLILVLCSASAVIALIGAFVD